MTEAQLQRLEQQIANAGPEAAAAIVVAAIARMGELGRPAGEAFLKLADGHSNDDDRGDFSEGMLWIEDVVA